MARWDGRRRRCRCPHRPTGGRGSSSRPTHNSVSPATLSMTSAYLGNGDATRQSSPRFESEEGFVDCVHSSAHPPIHRNRRSPVRDAQRTPEDRPEPVIPQSKKPLDLGQGFNCKLRAACRKDGVDLPRCSAKDIRMSRLRSSRFAYLLVLWPCRDDRSSMAQSGSRNVRSSTTLDGPRWSGPLTAWVEFRHGGRPGTF